MSILYFTVFSVAILLSANIYPTAIVIKVIATCPLDYFRVCYSAILYGNSNTSTHVPLIVLRDIGFEANGTTGSNIDDTLNGTTITDLAKFEYFSKIVLLMSSFSSSISYVLFIYALGRAYVSPHLKNMFNFDETLDCFHYIKNELKNLMGYPRSENTKLVQPLHPFNDNDNEYTDDGDTPKSTDDECTTTQLKWEEVPSYLVIFLANFLVNIGLCGMFLHYDILHVNKMQLINTKGDDYSLYSYYETSVFIAYTVSMFCTLSSCFIFSKLAYGIQRKCVGLAEYLEHVNKTYENLHDNIYRYLKSTNPEINFREFPSSQNVKLYYLQERAKHFIKVSKVTLNHFELWFFIHWILYIASTFFTLNLFIEAVMFAINSHLPILNNQNNHGIDFKKEEIIFLGLYSASNCLFFLYPCLRAAAITESQQVLIGKINADYIQYPHISPELKEQFVNFLKSQEFGFKLQVLCIKIPFHLSVAYASILISVFGVLFKVATSI